MRGLRLLRLVLLAGLPLPFMACGTIAMRGHGLVRRDLMPYTDPTQESGMRFFQHAITGPVTMLNLLRFRDVADYSANPTLAPPEPITGRAAYDFYIAHTTPFLPEAGGALTFIGEGGPFLIGPEDERWDLVMLVRQADVASFMGMANNEAYMSGIGHRTAALQDSRLLPIVESELPS